MFFPFFLPFWTTKTEYVDSPEKREYYARLNREAEAKERDSRIAEIAEIYSKDIKKAEKHVKKLVNHLRAGFEEESKRIDESLLSDMYKAMHRINLLENLREEIYVHSAALQKAKR